VFTFAWVLAFLARRLLPGWVLALSGCCLFTLAAQPLRDLANRRGLRIGTAVNADRLGELDYAETLAREFNQLEPENALKFAPIHPGPSSYNFTPVDTLVAFAQAHGMVVRGHTLVWHRQIPSWLTEGAYSPEALSSILEDHIRTVVGRYGGKVYAWDVVNEAFNSDGTLRSTLWSNTPGIGLKDVQYIEQAFRWAHASDPGALLFYNDYDAEALNPKSDAIYAMARDFVARGVPLNGIGVQMHLTEAAPSLSQIDENIRRIAALGLQVQITELDVRLPVDARGHASAADLKRQAQIYHDVTAACLKYQCTAIQTWGFTDKYSWVPGEFPGMGAALEFDSSYQPKSAYQSMEKTLRLASKNGIYSYQPLKLTTGGREP